MYSNIGLAKRGLGLDYSKPKSGEVTLKCAHPLKKNNKEAPCSSFNFHYSAYPNKNGCVVFCVRTAAILWAASMSACRSAIIQSLIATSSCRLQPGVDATARCAYSSITVHLYDPATA